MIDMRRATEAFERFLSAFDAQDEKIKLKKVHTYGVVRDAKRITDRMDLCEEDRLLAQLIALLHDIGRFEQVKRYDSFEPGTMDHAAFGVKILSENDHALLREFVPEKQWDEIILSAIATHSLYELPSMEEKRVLLHSRLIRDADKLDNCRVKLEDSLDILLGMDAEAVGMQEITEGVWEFCQRKKAVYSPVRVTRMDYWVSYIAYFFDIYYPATAQIILEEDDVRRVAERIPYGNPQTRERMARLVEMTEEYLRGLCDGAGGKRG